MRAIISTAFLIVLVSLVAVDAKKPGGFDGDKKKHKLQFPKADTLGGIRILKKMQESNMAHQRAAAAKAKTEQQFQEVKARAQKLQSGSGSEDEDPFDGYFYNPKCEYNTSYGIGLSRVWEQCSLTDFSFMEKKFVSKKAANAAWGKFCASPCIGSITGFLKTAYLEECDNGDIGDAKTVLGFCDQQDDSYCGAVIVSNPELQDHKCEHWRVRNNYTVCATHMPACYWNHDNRACERVITQTQIDSLCGPCMRNLAVLGGDEAAIYDQVCVKVEGHSCALENQAYSRLYDNKNTTGMTSEPAAPTLAAINHLCLANQSYRHTCLAATVAPIVESLTEYAEQTFENCWWYVDYYRRLSGQYANYSRDSSSTFYKSYYASLSDTYNSTARSYERQCINAFTEMVGTGHLIQHTILNMCERNNGKYCSQWLDTSNPDSRLLCGFAVGQSGTCSSDCEGEILSLANDMGCCLNAIHNPGIPISAEDFLPYKVNQSLVPRMIGSSVDLTVLEVCTTAKAKIQAGIAAGCSGNGSASSTFTIDLQINATIFGANASWVAMLKPAAMADVASNSGLGMAGLVDFTLAANTKGTYTVTFKVWGPRSLITSLVASSLSDRIARGALRFHRVDVLIGGTCRKFCRTAARTIMGTSTLTSFTAVTPDACMNNEFFSAMIGVYNDCGVPIVQYALNEDFTNLALANSSWGAACSTKCAASAKAMKQSRFGVCMDEYTGFFVDLLSVSCTSDANNYKCGAIMSTIGAVECGHLYNSSMCGSVGAGLCKWVSNVSQCLEAPTDAYVRTYCDGGCVGRLAATLAAGKNKEIAKGVTLMDRYFCSSDNGTMCLPLIADESVALDVSGMTTNVLVSICETPKKNRCFKRIWTAVAESAVTDAEDTFFECANSAYGGSWYTLSYCISQLMSNLKQAEQFDAQVSYMCVKNPKGAYCINSMDPYLYSSDSLVRYCIRNPLLGYTSSYSRCSSTSTYYNCSSTYASLVADLGCCTGTAHFLYGSQCTLPPAFLPDVSSLEREEYGEDDLTDYSGSDFSFSFTGSSSSSSSSAASSASAAVSSGSSSSGLTDAQIETMMAAAIANLNASWSANPYVKLCGGLFDLWNYCPTYFPLNTILTSQYGCIKPKSEGVNLTLDLGIAWGTVKSDEKKKARLIRKLKGDLGAKFGLAKDEYGSIELVEDSSSTITVSSSSRRMATQATTSGATTLKFQVATSDAANTAAVASQYQAVKAAGNLTLPSTTKAVSSECKNCTASGSASSVQTSADTSAAVESGGDSSTSGAATTAFLATLVVALFALLF